MGSYRMCLIFTRKFRVTEPGPVDDVRDVFEKYTDGEAHMSPEQLLKFMTEEEGGTESNIEEAERIVDEVLRRKHHIAKFTRRNLTLEDFNYFLFSTDLNPPIADQVHHKMDAPLSHYFIFTGHNSYLTGNQLSSNCSDLPIADALRRGVRVVELDLWPRGNDDVCVKHGRTLTKAVKLGKCLESIKAHAFTTSKYPVIITLEDHLTTKLQSKVAKMITQTFGDMLYYHDSEICKEFPSPQELLEKILISTKPPKEYLEANDAKEKDNGEKGKDSDEDVWGKEPADLISTQADLDKVSNSINYLNQDDEERESSREFDMSCQLQAPEYKRLIAIHAGKPKGGLHMALKVDPNKIRRLSLSEQLLEKAVASYGSDVIRFTQKNFLRIYPKGTRFNSSNYKPQIGWMSGAQMIAFNMQGYGRALWLMQGMFRANGGCGYVKKPDFLMTVGPDGQVFFPNENSSPKKTLKVKVCMGDGWHLDFNKTHFDLYSPPDFFVRVGIAGAPADEMMQKTKIKYDTWTPIWNEEFTFQLTVPELALLRVEVHEYDKNEKDDFGGQTCLPVFELRQGIRAVPLFNRKGEKYTFTRLLMRFEFV